MYTKRGHLVGALLQHSLYSIVSSGGFLAPCCCYIEASFYQSQPTQLSESERKLECLAFTRYIGTGTTCEVFTFGCDAASADDGDGCGDMLGTSGPDGGSNFYTAIEFTVRLGKYVFRLTYADLLSS